MNTVQQLRADVDLPANYRVKLPIKERRKILSLAIAEQRLCNRMASIKAPAKYIAPPKALMTRSKFIAASRRVLIAKTLTEIGPASTLEINKIVGCGMKSIRGQVAYLMKMGWVKKTGGKRLVGQKRLTLYVITDAGRIYGAQK